MRTTHLAQAAAAVVVLALAPGCVTNPRTRLIEAHTSAYVFHHPATEVRAAVKALLEEGRFEVDDSTPGEMIRTDWRPIIDDELFATSYERYVVIVKRLTPEHCRVQAVKMTVSSVGMETYHPHSEFKRDGLSANVNNANYGKGESPLLMGRPSLGRDLGFEWRLVTRVEPQRAALLEQSVALQLHR